MGHDSCPVPYSQCALRCFWGHVSYFAYFKCLFVQRVLAVLSHAVPCCAALCFAVLGWVAPGYVMLCCAMLSHPGHME